MSEVTVAQKIASSNKKPAWTVDAWKKARGHIVTLPSGAQVRIEIPDLPKLIETGQVPQSLLSVALKVAQGGQLPTPSPELAGEQREFTDMIVKMTVVNPKLEDADLPDIPYEDKDMIVQFAMRERDMDAEYKHIGGLHKSATFRAVRELPSLDSTLEDV